MDHKVLCLEQNADCVGPVEYRVSMSPTGKRFPRCEHHFSVRLDRQEGISRRYDIPMFYGH